MNLGSTDSGEFSKVVGVLETVDIGVTRCSGCISIIFGMYIPSLLQDEPVLGGKSGQHSIAAVTFSGSQVHEIKENCKLKKTLLYLPMPVSMLTLTAISSPKM